MGCKLSAVCRDCHSSFEVYEGGAILSHALRCEECGETKFVSIYDLGELHTRFAKGLPGAYAGLTERKDAFIREFEPVEPISQTEYFAGIEAVAGHCSCGGKFTLTASPRCPACRSTNVSTGVVLMDYD